MSLDEGVDGDFVGRVEDTWGDAAGGHGVSGKAETGVAFEFWGTEVELESLREINCFHDSWAAFWVEKAVLDGEGHVWGAELGEDGAVYELGHRVNDALGVDDDVDLVGGQVEEPAGFDHFESLVGHRCGVECDFGPHVPVGVVERLLEGDVFKLFEREVAEASTGGGKD